jgi:hypothetical protein
MKPPCPPFSPCWCEMNPGHPRCTVSVPISNTLIEIVLILSICLVVFFVINKKNNRNNQKNLEV